MKIEMSKGQIQFLLSFLSIILFFVLLVVSVVERGNVQAKEIALDSVAYVKENCPSEEKHVEQFTTLEENKGLIIGDFIE